MNNFIAIMAVIGIVFVIVTILLGRLRKRWPKYMPAVLTGAAVVAAFVKAKWFSEGFEGLAYIILFLMALITFIVSLITAVILEIIRARNRRTAQRADGPAEGGGGPSDKGDGPEDETGTGI